MRRGRTTSFKGKDWQRLPYFGLNLCGSQSRAGRTPPPREARNVRMLTAPTPGRPTLKSTFLIHRPICRVRPVAHPPKPLRGLGDEAGDPLGSQEHAQFTAHSGKFVLGAPPPRR